MPTTIKPNSLSVLLFVDQARGEKIIGKKTGEPLKYVFETKSWVTKKGGKTDKPEQIYPRQIYCRVTINSRPTLIVTGLKIDITKWDNSMRRVKGNSKEAVMINDELLNLQKKIKDTFDSMNEEKFITIEEFKYQFHRLDKKKPPLLFSEVCNRFLDYCTNKQLAKGTIEHYQSMIKTLQTFVSHKYGKDVPVDLLNEKDIYYQVKDFFQAEGYQNGTINNLLSLLRNVFIRAEIVSDFKCIAAQAEYMPRPESYKYYTEQEMELITNFKTDRKDLELMHKITLLQIEVGLAHADMSKLTYDHIQMKMVGNTTRKYIYINRKKSKELAVIPVTPRAEQLMDEIYPYVKVLATHHWENVPQYLKRFSTVSTKKEKFANKVVPMPKRYTTSKMLNAIGYQLGIKMTSHRARHTFGTKMLNYFPLETVSKMLGHKTVSTTERIYAKVLDTRVVTDTINHNWENNQRDTDIAM